MNKMDAQAYFREKGYFEKVGDISDDRLLTCRLPSQTLIHPILYLLFDMVMYAKSESIDSLTFRTGIFVSKR